VAALRVFQHGQATAGRIRMHYLDWSGSEPPILLLHPNQMNAHIWELAVAASTLPNRFLAPDQRGHGHSDYPAAGYLLSDYVADDVALLDALAIRRVVLVGAATGGNLALLLASRWPERVSGLVVINPALNLEASYIAQMQDKLRSNFRQPTFEAAAAAIPFSERWDSARLEAFARTAFRSAPDGGYEWAVSLDAVLSTYAGLVVGSLWENIAARCPTLLIRGEGSPVFSDSDARRLQSVIAGCQAVTLRGTGQLVMMDDPAGVAAHIDAFVRALPDSDRLAHL
jgi:pimeloyl-ACP methyl ester carboxylesterase